MGHIMDGIERPIWFLGDLDDPWVLSILAATADSSRRESDSLQW